MKMVIVCLFDTAVGAYARPAFVRSDGEAMRTFIDQVNTEKLPDGNDNPMFAHPDHFALFHLGQFDDADGKFYPPSAGVPFELITGQRAKLNRS